MTVPIAIKSAMIYNVMNNINETTILGKIKIKYNLKIEEKIDYAKNIIKENLLLDVDLEKKKIKNIMEKQEEIKDVVKNCENYQEIKENTITWLEKNIKEIENQEKNWKIIDGIKGIGNIINNYPITSILTITIGLASIIFLANYTTSMGNAIMSGSNQLNAITQDSQAKQIAIDAAATTAKVTTTNIMDLGVTLSKQTHLLTQKDIFLENSIQSLTNTIQGQNENIESLAALSTLNHDRITNLVNWCRRLREGLHMVRETNVIGKSLPLVEDLIQETSKMFMPGIFIIINFTKVIKNNITDINNINNINNIYKINTVNNTPIIINNIRTMFMVKSKKNNTQTEILEISNPINEQNNVLNLNSFTLNITQTKRGNDLVLKLKKLKKKQETQELTNDLVIKKPTIKEQMETEIHKEIKTETETITGTIIETKEQIQPIIENIPTTRELLLAEENTNNVVTMLINVNNNFNNNNNNNHNNNHNNTNITLNEALSAQIEAVQNAQITTINVSAANVVTQQATTHFGYYHSIMSAINSALNTLGMTPNVLLIAGAVTASSIFALRNTNLSTSILRTLRLLPRNVIKVREIRQIPTMSIRVVRKIGLNIPAIDKFFGKRSFST